MMQFTSDEYAKVTSNLAHRSKILSILHYRNPDDKTCTFDIKDVDNLRDAIEKGLNFMAVLSHNIYKQFENGSTRKTCPNKDCHTIYAFFYENFKYCPYCGAELVVTPGYPEELHDIFIPIRNGSPAWYKSPKDAAKELNVGETTIRQWFRRGEIPDALKIGREVWVPNWWIVKRKLKETYK